MGFIILPKGEKIPYTDETRDAVLSDIEASGRAILGESHTALGYFFEVDTALTPPETDDMLAALEVLEVTVDG